MKVRWDSKVEIQDWMDSFLFSDKSCSFKKIIFENLRLQVFGDGGLWDSESILLTNISRCIPFPWRILPWNFLKNNSSVRQLKWRLIAWEMFQSRVFDPLWLWSKSWNHEAWLFFSREKSHASGSRRFVWLMQQRSTRTSSSINNLCKNR